MTVDTTNFEGWKKFRLGDIVKIIGGGTPKTSEENYWGGDIPWLTPRDLSKAKNEEKYVSFGERNISASGLANSSAKLLPKDAVLLTTRAPIGYLRIAKNPIATNQGFKNLVCDKNFVLPEFLYYLLLHNVEYLKSVGVGTTFAEISGSALGKLEFYIPSIDVQEKIIENLSPIDDKIELNRRMNATLEEMAQAIFKEWFVDFNFPGTTDEFVDSALGPIPIGWETQPIGEVFDFVIGGDWGDETQQDDSQILCNVVRGTDLPGIGLGSIDKIPKRYISSRRLLTRELISNDIVFEISGGSTNQSTGRNFQFSKKILCLFSKPVVPTSFCRLIRINEEIMSHYIGAQLTYFYDTGEAWDYQVQSTGISNFQFKDFCKRKLIVIPPKDILLKYSEIKKIIQNITGVLAKNNLTLINLRDNLLRNLFDTKTRQGA